MFININKTHSCILAYKLFPTPEPQTQASSLDHLNQRETRESCVVDVLPLCLCVCVTSESLARLFERAEYVGSEQWVVLLW